MNLTLETSISAITVFFQGLISFFSPCVLPLIPLYIGYLSGGAKTVDEEGNITYKRGRVMRNTLFFVLGISFAFFLLGFGFTAVGKFFHNYRTWFTRVRQPHLEQRAPFPLPARLPGHEPPYCPYPWFYFQLRMDTLRRPGTGQRSSFSCLCGILPYRIFAAWGLHFGLCAAFPGCRAVHQCPFLLL